MLILSSGGHYGGRGGEGARGRGARGEGRGAVAPLIISD